LTKNQTLLSGPLPIWLSSQPAPILARFGELGVFDNCSEDTNKQTSPNHVLVNEYLPGQGIMPHEDGPAYWPVVATVSLGASLVLDLYEKKDGGSETKPRWRVFQEPGSLLVTRGNAYDSMLHGIAGVEVDEDMGPETVANWSLLGDKESLEVGKSVRGTRVSLTYRVVRKVSKVSMSILGLGGKK
jgi:alkylated DNA repair protein alkB family protein 6